MGICFAILFILGTALFLAAVVALADANVFSGLAITGFKEVIIFALCLGLFVAIVSIVGALGYFTLNRAMLIIFICGLGLLVILQVACGATAFAYKDDFNELTKKAWDVAEESTRAYFQEEFECCGGLDILDHAAPSEHCVGTNFTEDLLASAASSSAFHRGCVGPVVEAINDNMTYIGVGDIVITVLEIVVIIVTAVVIYQIRKAGKSYHKFNDEDAISSLRDD